jgi:hypothetical protein
LKNAIELTVDGVPSFAYRLSNDELYEFRRASEVRYTTFGAGTRMSIRASELMSLVEELLQLRKNNSDK